MTEPVPPFGLCDAGKRALAIAMSRRRFASLNELTDEELTSLTQAHGIDAATSLLYELLRTAPVHRQLIERIETPDVSTAGDQVAHRIVIVPGAFYREYPKTGADGSRVLELATSLGWPVERAPLASFAPMAANAAVLANFLGSLPSRPTILFSLSKGGADVRAAMERPDASEVLRDVRAWVNVSGLVTGTALVNWFKTRPIRCAMVKLLLRIRRQRFETLEELRRGPASPLGKPFTIPHGIKVIHVAGFPLACHLSDRWARRGHKRLANIGPNDGGGVLLADLARIPGSVYPVWGADHYLRPAWDIRPLLLRILQEAAAT